ncbi:helix-turn-helix domain-containing protein [Cupriavidus necator]|uniref:IclR family transcriptional regulator n=1 Tax=Cupriavidus necator TaxID=106590 RepID=UPI003ECF35B6
MATRGDSVGGKASSRKMTSQTGEFTRDTAGSESLMRGMLLLRAFRVGTDNLTNGELAERTGLPRPTISRLTRVLVDAGFLRYDVETRGYRLAASVLSLADAFNQANRAPELALPLMRKVAEADKVNVGLAVADLQEMVYLASVRHSRDSVTRTRRVVMPGTRVPMELTALGLAWLAALPEPARDELLGVIAARQGAAWSGMKKDVANAIAQALRDGYCTAAYQPGHMLAVATTFIGPDRQRYSVNVSFPYEESSMGADCARHAATLLQLVADIRAAWRG